MKILGGLQALYFGRPFGTPATSKTEEEVLAELRARKPERCEIIFDEGLLEIDLLPPFPWVNRARTVFKGKFQQEGAGLQVSGKFQFLLMLRISMSLLLGMALLLGITSGSWFLVFIVPVAVTFTLSGIISISDLSNRDREKIIKSLLNDITQAPGQ